jgi:hypothetical protein
VSSAGILHVWRGLARWDSNRRVSGAEGAAHSMLPPEFRPTVRAAKKIEAVFASLATLRKPCEGDRSTFPSS